PSTVELGGKSPNIYFEDIMQAEPAFIEKAAEGLVLAFFNQGEVCTCPSRALVQESIYPAFMEEVLKKVRAIKRGDPLDTETMVGAQASQQQYEKILSYLDIAQQEGAEVLTGGSVEKLEGNLASGYYIQPTLLKGHNKMRVFQEEIFGPVVGVTTFKDEAEALAIANDTEYGLGFFNQGEVCTCPSRALVQESIYPAFMEEVLKKVRAIKRGDPLDTETMVGAQASQQQYEKILSYLDIAQQEGAELLAGGSVEKLEGNLASGYYIQPTLLKGHNGMRVFQEEIFGPVVGVTTFKDEAEALAIANDTEYGLGAGLWTRDINRAYRMGRGIKAGRVWTNCYHLYPAHAAFGGYKKSGVGRETHKMMLDHYQQTKNLLVSYDINPLGFF
ncbi:aldehyde dehydrogenase family protein, partial [Pseudomonas aeruginosa]|uniref:aldehyde dehydrogenase family protein n=1 Tax=Pseudomonas aeruginosa TaxID=287 RepID=UPI002043F7B6